MQMAVMNVESLGLPPFAVEKIGSRKVLVKEVTEGILLSPVQAVPNLRGKYRGVFSTEQFLVQKQTDKDLEP
ncbi:MAG: hypothetical protein FWG93_05045 [Oscillospiraceae bacterium]|nr:hypothetical protein [Oscillospiraceae bacterium]